MSSIENASELSRLRSRNLRRVVHAIRDHPGVHLSAVSARTGLASGAVSSLVNDLVDAEVVRDQTLSAGGRGRPRRILALRDDYADVVGVRVTRSTIDVRSATLAGRALRSETRAWAEPWSIDDAGAMIAEMASAAVDGASRSTTTPFLVVSIPGATVGNAVGSAELDWRTVATDRLLNPLHRAGFARASVGNDGSLATLAEARRGAARGYSNAAVLLLGRGLGGSAVVDGKLLRGSRFAPGLGHTPVDPAGPTCICGLRGCIELYASLQSIAVRLGEGTALAYQTPNSYARTLASRAEVGEPCVLEALADVRKRIRSFADLLGAVLDPDAVILSGPTTALSPWLIAEPPRPVGPIILPGELGDDAALMGAVLAAQDDALDDPLAVGRRLR
jgi:predicted NBD/HSP70 family sugar kinase